MSPPPPAPALKLKLPNASKIPKLVVVKAGKGGDPDAASSSSGKKRRHSAVDDGEGAGGESKAKKTKSDKPDFDVPDGELKPLMNKMISNIKNFADKSGRILSTLFLVLPSKALYPDYYQFIKNPISIREIQGKITTGKYATIGALRMDVELMFENAMTYNMPESEVYEDAGALLNVFMKDFEKARNEHSKKEQITLKLSGKKADSTKTPAKGDAAGGGSKSSSKKKTDGKESSGTSIKLVMKSSGASTPSGMGSPPLNSKEQDIKDMFKAALENNVKVVERLCKKPWAVNVRGPAVVDDLKFEWTPLHAASFYGRTRIIDLLCQNGADVKAVDTLHKATPLHWAAYGGKDGAAKRLVRMHHADRQAKNDHGQTPVDLVPNREDPVWAGVLTPALPKPPKEIEEAKKPAKDKPAKDNAEQETQEKREKKASKEKVQGLRDEKEKGQKIGGSPLLKTHVSQSGKAGTASTEKGKQPAHTPGQPIKGDASKSKPADSHARPPQQHVAKPQTQGPAPGAMTVAAFVPGPRDPDQLLVFVGGKAGESRPNCPASYLRRLDVFAPEDKRLIMLPTSQFKSNGIHVSRNVHSVRINLILEPGASDKLFYSVHVSQNRLLPRVPRLSSEQNLTLEVLADLKDGLNYIEVILAAYMKVDKAGAAASDSSSAQAEYELVKAPTGKSSTQKYTIFIQRAVV
ncbi:hypothetical protein HDV05_004361 [Chytridiales sp. JEL 0842]|nr:hypothetical protein HDV05_004361 [Chytridiales sp. JEL 0842]